MWRSNNFLCFEHNFAVTLVEEESGKTFDTIYKKYDCSIEVSKEIAEAILEISLDKCPTMPDLGIYDLEDEVLLANKIKHFYEKQSYAGLIMLSLDYGSLHEGWIKRVIFEQYSNLLTIDTNN